MLRFHSRFFTPAVEASIPVTAAGVRYIAQDGTPERELCWFGDDTFVSHAWKTLGGPDFCAEVHFGEPHLYADRRTAAVQTFAEIENMRAQGALVVQ
jgi:hypothetical protein